MDWIYGFKPVAEMLAMDPGRVLRVLVSRRRRKGVEELARYGVQIQRVEPRVLDEKFDGANHQGIAAECRPFVYTALFDWLEGAPEDAVVMILDGVQDAGNLGAILRSCVATGAHAVILPSRKAAGVTPAAMRASAGLARRIPVIRVNNLARTMDTLRDHGFWITGAATRGGSPPWAIDFAGRVGVVLGSEAKGMRRLVGEKCDYHATVPLVEGAESLNVSVAAAMILYEIGRQRAKASATPG